MADDTPPLIAEIDSFLADHSMSPVTFGRKAMNDPHFVRDVRGGRRVWPATEAKARSFMAMHRQVETQSA